MFQWHLLSSPLHNTWQCLPPPSGLSSMFHSNVPCSIPTSHVPFQLKASACAVYIPFQIANLVLGSVLRIWECVVNAIYTPEQYPCAENNTLRNDYNQPHPMISLWYSKYCSTVMGQLHTQQSLHQQWCRTITFPDSAEPGTFFSVNGIL